MFEILRHSWDLQFFLLFLKRNLSACQQLETLSFHFLFNPFTSLNSMNLTISSIQRLQFLLLAFNVLLLYPIFTTGDFPYIFSSYMFWQHGVISISFMFIQSCLRTKILNWHQIWFRLLVLLGMNHILHISHEIW